MKYTITIEETCAKDFEIDANSVEEVYDLVKRNYNINESALDPGECQFRQMAIMKSSAENTEWQEF